MGLEFTLALLLFNVAPLREAKNASSKQPDTSDGKACKKKSHATAQR